MIFKSRFGARHRWGALVAIALLLASCSSTETPAEIGSLEDSAPAAEVAPSATSANSDLTAGLPRLDGQATVEIMVGNQPITVELDGTNAPYTAGNFVDLAGKGVYDGTIFHRVVTTPTPFVAQGGDPQSTDPNVSTSQLGTGNYIDPETGQVRSIPLEITPAGAEEPVYGSTFESVGLDTEPALPHSKGAIAMARSGVNTASAQFYITLADANFLDGDYAVFGYVTDGIDVVDNIQLGDVIQSVKVTSGADNLVQPGDGEVAE